MPFVLQFYGQATTYLWEDGDGHAHHVQQGEGGEQSDAFMSLLFAIGQHAALEAVKALLLPGERLFAFLDDVYVVCLPERAVAIHGVLREELWAHAGTRIHNGKTKLWNRSGVRPPGSEALEEEARHVDPRAVVWRGDAALPQASRGIEVLGAPLGTPELVRGKLRDKLAEHEALLDRMPAVPDL